MPPSEAVEPLSFPFRVWESAFCKHSLERLAWGLGWKEGDTVPYCSSKKYQLLLQQGNASRLASTAECGLRLHPFLHMSCIIPSKSVLTVHSLPRPKSPDYHIPRRCFWSRSPLPERSLATTGEKVTCLSAFLGIRCCCYSTVSATLPFFICMPLKAGRRYSGI